MIDSLGELEATARRSDRRASRLDVLFRTAVAVAAASGLSCLAAVVGGGDLFVWAGAQFPLVAALSFVLRQLAIGCRERAARFREVVSRETVRREQWDRDVARWEDERRASQARYDAALTAAYEVARRATDLLPPAADPAEVADRLRDLDLDVTTSVAPDGSVTVTLRRKAEPAVVG